MPKVCHAIGPGPPFNRSKIKFDLHDIFNKGKDIDHAMND